MSVLPDITQRNILYRNRKQHKSDNTTISKKEETLAEKN